MIEVSRAFSASGSSKNTMQQHDLWIPLFADMDVAVHEVPLSTSGGNPAPLVRSQMAQRTGVNLAYRPPCRTSLLRVRLGGRRPRDGQSKLPIFFYWTILDQLFWTRQVGGASPGRWSNRPR